MITTPFQYINQWLTEKKSSDYFDYLKKELSWQEEFLHLYGKKIKVPRLVCWYGDIDTSYTYSDKLHTALPWDPILFKIKNDIQKATKQSFNSVLCNLYKTGLDYMGWHRDNEKELGQNPIIASLSLGETRRFLFRNIETKEKIEINLSSGSLLIMKDYCQNEWEHSLPKTRTVKSPRINLTFRYIYS